MTKEKPPFPGPEDQQFLNAEWDTLFGFMIGRLIRNGYSPAQIQAKVRTVADTIRNAVKSIEGAQAAEEVRRGMDTLQGLVEDEDEDEDSE